MVVICNASHTVNYAYILSYRIPKSSARVLEYIPAAGVWQQPNIWYHFDSVKKRNTSLCYIFINVNDSILPSHTSALSWSLVFEVFHSNF